MNPTLSDVLASFVAVEKALLEPGVKVYDGPVPTGSDPDHSLSIGHTPIPDEPGARVEDPTTESSELPEWATADVITVVSTIEVKSGASAEGTIPTLRDIASGTLLTVRNSIKGDSPLGLTGLAWARVGDIEYTPSSNSSGSTVLIQFTTTFQSRTNAG